MIQPERIRILGGRRIPLTGRGRDFVLYWMQASQRAEGNHALEFAADQANELGKPLVVYFGLIPDFPEASLRHYAFMLEGIAETRRALASRGIRMIIRRVSPGKGAAELGRRAALTVVDEGWLRIERRWRSDAVRGLDGPLLEVGSNVIVPIETASDKEEYAAATFRPRIRRRLESFLAPLKPRRMKKDSFGIRLDSSDSLNSGSVPASFGIDRTVGPSHFFRGGLSEARARLDDFLENRLGKYSEAGRDPSEDATSGLSPYLHFGQISPLEIALGVRGMKGPGAARFLEELIVRRELAFNFVRYNPRYDGYEGLPEWSRISLAKHAAVPRAFIYTKSDLEKARTHDPFWNAAQNELTLTGKMHGTMRMYWGKKILEWTTSPEKAFRIALGLNNKYGLDGRDPNGFAGVAWCFGKHDRPWPERPIFGFVRYMNEAGLRRKFDMEAYIERIAALKA